MAAILDFVAAWRLSLANFIQDRQMSPPPQKKKIGASIISITTILKLDAKPPTKNRW